jgi:hypothetical protein
MAGIVKHFSPQGALNAFLHFYLFFPVLLAGLLLSLAYFVLGKIHTETLFTVQKTFSFLPVNLACFLNLAGSNFIRWIKRHMAFLISIDRFNPIRFIKFHQMALTPVDPSNLVSPAKHQKATQT